MTTKNLDGRSVLDGFRASGSFKSLFPRAQGAALDAVLLNTAGGVTGGDRFDFTGEAGADTILTLTTQACERAYKARSGETAHIRNHLRIGDGARINWLPQETILFDECAIDRRLTIDLAPTANLLMVEPLVFGRPAMGETLGAVQLHDRVQIRRQNEILFLDAIRLNGAFADHMALRFTAGGAGAMALIVMVNPRAEALLSPVRALLGPTAGASLLRPDLLVCRIMADNSFALRKTLLPVLQRLTGAPLPRCWMI